MCNGTEETLLECPRSYRGSDGTLIEREVGESDCSHAEDAGVRCDGECFNVVTVVLRLEEQTACE